MLKVNPYQKTMYTWMAITVAAVIMIFLPELLGIDGFSGGYAISFMSFIGVITGVIVAFVYNGLSSRFNAIIGGSETLVRWTYPPKLWKSYSDEEFEESITEVKPLFILTSMMCLVVGVGTFLFDPEPGIYVLGVMVLIIIIIGLTAFFTRKQSHHNNIDNLGEAIIARNGVVLNNRLQCWGYLGSKLVDVKLRKGDDYSVLIFTTWAPTLQAGQSYSLRVPVPIGEEAKALEIVSTFTVD